MPWLEDDRISNCETKENKLWRITHSYFRVAHSTREGFLLTLIAVLAIECLLDLQFLLRNLLCVLVFGILLGGLLERLKSLGVLTHGEKNIGLANVGFDYGDTSVLLLLTVGDFRRLTELGIHLDGLVGILECLRKGNELHVRSSTVIVAPSIPGITLDTLGVVLDGTCEVAAFEFGIALFTRSMAFLRVNVCLTVSICFLLLEVAQFVENVGCAVFAQRLVIELDSLLEFALLLVR
jgi:hypothetical protein